MKDTMIYVLMALLPIALLVGFQMGKAFYLANLPKHKVKESDKILSSNKGKSNWDSPEKERAYYAAKEKEDHPNGLIDRGFASIIHPVSYQINFNRIERERISREMASISRLSEEDKINFNLAVEDAKRRGDRFASFPGGWHCEALTKFAINSGFSSASCGNNFDLWVSW